MSALGQKRIFAARNRDIGFVPKADVGSTQRDACRIALGALPVHRLKA